MTYFINLLKNECRKNIMRKGSIVMIVVLLGLILFSTLIVKEKSNKDNAVEWTEQVKESVLAKQQMIEEGSLPSSYVQKYKDEIIVENYQLEHNIAPVQSNSIYGFVKGTADLNVIIALFSIIIAGGILTNEYSSGTIKLLMIRPWKRYKILLSK